MSETFQFRAAGSEDLPQIVALLADDPIAVVREQSTEERRNQGLSAYERAFGEIESDPNNCVLVTVANAGDRSRIIAVLQLTFIPSLTYSGGKRAQIEGVRVHEDWRSRGVGEALMRHAIDLAREADCVLVQLTTDRRREAAHRFYERLGFVTSHWGMKLHLKDR